MVSLDALFANSDVRAQVRSLLDAPRGIIVFNGDAGSGKTTGIFVLAEELRNRGRTCTVFIKDPELRAGLLAQSSHAQWDTRLVPDVADAWAAALAEVAPEHVTVVQEMDYHSARAIINAAERGGIFLTVMGSPYIGIDAAYSLQNNGITTDEFLRLFSCVASQMLVPRLCDRCRVQVTLGADEARTIDPSAAGPATVWKEVGCEQCGGSGLQGRLALHEVLIIDDAARPVLANYLDKGDLRNPLPPGHISVQETARQLLADGRIGVNTYRRQITQNPILRMQHQWELESRRASRIREMFSRFVTTQVVDKMLADSHVQEVIDGERRRITCMFADIRGFTTLAEGMPAHELFVLLNRYFKEIIQTVAEHGGTIDKFVGDCVMVIFGAPVDQADHEYQAVQCAQRIHRCVAALNRVRYPAAPIEMGIGVNTGDAVTGCLGSELRMDYTALGDTVNVAARLESRAPAGTILIGEATARAVAQRIAVHAVGALRLKGKSSEIRAFEVKVDEVPAG